MYVQTCVQLLWSPQGLEKSKWKEEAEGLASLAAQ